MTQAPDTAPTFTDEVAHLLTRIGEQHHPAMAGTPSERSDARRMFARYARNYGRINRGHHDPRETDTRQDWTGLLLEPVYDLLAELTPARQREHLVQVAALCAAWAADIDRGTAQRAEAATQALDNTGWLTKLDQPGSCSVSPGQQACDNPGAAHTDQEKPS